MKRTKVGYEFVIYPETKIDPNGVGLYGDMTWIDCKKKGELQEWLNDHDVNDAGLFPFLHVYVKRWYCTYEEPYSEWDEWEWDEFPLYYDHDKKVWIDPDEFLPKYVMKEINNAKFPKGSLQKYPAGGYELIEDSTAWKFDEKSKCWIYG